MGTEPLLTRLDPNGAARAFDVPHSDRTAPPPAGEESRLDEAMRRADDLLITSLRDEEARRLAPIAAESGGAAGMRQHHRAPFRLDDGV